MASTTQNPELEPMGSRLYFYFFHNRLIKGQALKTTKMIYKFDTSGRTKWIFEKHKFIFLLSNNKKTKNYPIFNQQMNTFAFFLKKQMSKIGLQSCVCLAMFFKEKNKS